MKSTYNIALTYIAFYALIGVAIYVSKTLWPLWALWLSTSGSSIFLTAKDKDDKEAEK